MKIRELEPRELRSWALLGMVEDHPKVRAWLEEASALNAPGTAVSGTASRLRFWAAAAAFAFVAIGGALAYRHYSVPRYETRIGEQRDVILEDGSRITMNTDTAVEVRYASGRRLILLQRGEALFAVKGAAARPFEVSAGGVVTRALGTEFNVDLRRAKVTVSVLEGTVRVTPSGASTGASLDSSQESGSAEPPAVELSRGQALEFRPGLRRMFPESADLRRIDAWRTRRLEFNETPLAEAVEEFNRYSSTRVTIGATEMLSIRVGGVFRIGDADSFLYSLHEALGLEVHRTANEAVLMPGGMQKETPFGE